MGNCCDGKSILDFLNLQLDKENKPKNRHFSDFQSQTDYNIDKNNIQENIIDDKQNISPSIPFISKKILKLKILQSKYLIEGKTYIINSLGLIDPKNKYYDGLTIFGDENVCK